MKQIVWAFLSIIFVSLSLSAQVQVQPYEYPIIPKTAWNAKPAKPYKAHKPVRITVHHEGGRVLTVEDDATQRLRNIQSWCMGPDRNWADIPYHYLIAPDGTVYEGRNVMTVGETNTDYDPTGHLLISFLGNYNEQEMNENLEEVLVNLVVHFCKKYNISPDTIATHRDYTGHTNCPGKNLYPYFENNIIVNKVKQRI
ncbi:N-acetylmuramoyl-L-alanine amidase [Sphingobacterium alimentarium]|uniref:N-acetylmuramoyl-L-alanine amidase n=1 Tax=Sphingobacterium alimentarium TaxID=797292 RepID=A0A4R3W329_9SPHI|nr:peptidoglycan recognition family protein [Sphingobacterium alimentarium]TCV20030.1 N-acetylmuramoyl-L-alanine amidase [Sphingobacterium alimentarium]